MNAISSKPAYPCPLRDEALVLIDVCNACPHLKDFTEYYQPREGGVVYCDFRYFEHEAEYRTLRAHAQDEAIKQLHRDESKRTRELEHAIEHGAGLT